MKKLIYLFLVLGLFACSSDSENDNTNPINENPVYLDSNGVTIKARDWAVVGDSGIIDGVEYIIVDEIDIYNRILNSESLANICTTAGRVTANQMFKHYFL